MKEMIFRFTVLVVILMLFNMTHLEGNQSENEKKKKGSLTDIICRAIIGFEQSAASSLDRKQGLFVDLSFFFPIVLDPTQKGNKASWIKSKFSIWGNIRLTSTPLNIESNIEELSTDGGFVSKISEVKINQVAQAVEFQGGLEFRLLPWKPKEVNHNFNFIAGVNASTPISVKEAIAIFEISEDIKTQYPNEDYTGIEYVALVPPSRDKFFRQYYLGFRLKSNITQKKKNEENEITQTKSSFPAVLDIVYGWKDRGTHGPLRGFFKAEFFIPLRLGNTLNVYLFGSIILKTSKTKLSDHLFLKSAPEEVTYPAANILRITTPEINRDFYRVGIGIDVLSIFD